MTFNKWFPERVEPPQRRLSNEGRAWVVRGAWYVSTLMLMGGYVLVFALWNR